MTTQFLTDAFLNDVTFTPGTFDDKLDVLCGKLDGLVMLNEITLNEAYTAIQLVLSEFKLATV